jgi:predicted RNase H-like nuclease
VNTFIGVDLGWYGKPSGLASIEFDALEYQAVLPASAPERLRVRNIERLEALDKILAWIVAEAANGDSVVAVDAPLIIRNETGVRPAEREMNRDFRRFHAGCHAANLGRPFAQNVLAFSERLKRLGFEYGASIQPRQRGRFQIEVHPHAAAVNLFGLGRIVKYKRGKREARAHGLCRLRALMLACLPELNPPLSLTLPVVPPAGNLKPVEDRIDAVICAYVAAHWWVWANRQNRLYGDDRNGFIVVPERYSRQGGD